jgi:hypothetical protein
MLRAAPPLTPSARSRSASGGRATPRRVRHATPQVAYKLWSTHWLVNTMAVRAPPGSV